MGFPVLSLEQNAWRKPDGSIRKHLPGDRKYATQDFMCVDGEGITFPNGEHRYVLLGAGEEQIDNPNGLHWTEIFEFLYSLHKPHIGYAGFYLGYDFTQWLRTLPEDRARRLLTIEGKAARKSQSPKLKGRYLPVDIGGWQVDMVGAKRLDIRRKECSCQTFSCPHPKGRWMHICDTGPFFQTSFLNVINPKNWEKPIVSDREFETILEGKERRSVAQLDSDMRKYNMLENEVLARVLRDLNDGMKRISVHLQPKQWFGPGQAAQQWMKGRAPRTDEIQDVIPTWYLEAARQSYFGGWFEIMMHGIIPGTSHEYDINSAYPYIIAQLPCLLHGNYTMGVGKPSRDISGLTLVRARVWRKAPGHSGKRNHHIGAMLHRDNKGRINRPMVTEGWYWLHELRAAIRAGCITRISDDRYFEWVNYEPCQCLPPLREVKGLYEIRLEVGKNSSMGKSAKLIYNSEYGKTAQSVGSPIYGNPVYASLITAGCRTMILDAIATHPEGLSHVAMVATDGIYFLSPHPLLPLGKELGEWEHAERERLTLFKPGVYWDDKAREQIASGSHVAFKARGVNATDFAKAIAEIDATFESWNGKTPSIGDGLLTAEELASTGAPMWPRVSFDPSFAMVSCLQALTRNKWELAGTLNVHSDECGLDCQIHLPLVQNANPRDKRTHVWYDDSIPGRPIYRSEPHAYGANATFDNPASVPYEKRFGLEDPFSDETKGQLGVTPDDERPFISAMRVLTGQE